MRAFRREGRVIVLVGVPAWRGGRGERQDMRQLVQLRSSQFRGLSATLGESHRDAPWKSGKPDRLDDSLTHGKVAFT